jgi:hypothetical protein
MKTNLIATLLCPDNHRSPTKINPSLAAHRRTPAIYVNNRLEGNALAMIDVMVDADTD